MLLPKQKRLPKKLIFIIAALLLIIASCFVYVYAFNGNIFGWKAEQNSIRDNNSVDYSPPSTDQQKAGTDAKINSTNDQDSSKSDSDNDTPPDPVQQPNSNKSLVTLDITSDNQTDSTYQVRTLIGVVTDEGNCVLSMTKDGRQVTKSVAVYALAKTSTCQGFDIPMSELSAGTWTLKINFTNSTLIGNVSKSIIIK